MKFEESLDRKNEKYFLTFCATDTDVASNLMWHSCIFLSIWCEDKKQMEVVDTWGFYGLPTTECADTWKRRLKIMIGLDVDLIGNHGMLRHEDSRFLDVGIGLHGVTFELTKELFALLQQKCLEMVQDQEAAVREIVEPLGLKGKASDKTRIYPHEDNSLLIYQLENLRAKQYKRESRLKPFELRLSWSLWGPSLKQSSTCKSQVIRLLSHVLSPEQIARLTENGKHPTVPRFSGPMETIYLHSTGPLRQHIKSSGQVVHYRNKTEDPAVKILWTVPPQEIEVLSEDTIKLLDIDSSYIDEVKQVVSRLQQLEWLFRNADLPEQFNKIKADLIEQIIARYKPFSIIEPKQDEVVTSGVTGFIYSLFSLPRSSTQQRVQTDIKHAKWLINSLYMAVVDHWSFPESTDEDSLPEALAAYLTTQDQQRLCKIIGRTYCDDEFLEEHAHEPCSSSQVG